MRTRIASLIICWTGLQIAVLIICLVCPVIITCSFSTM
jgi:hypothetical protein